MDTPESDRVAAAIETRLGPGANARHWPNHAGPNKLSFRVDTPTGAWWVKVARHARDERDLRQWAAVADRLTTRHRAVPVVGHLWLEDRFGLQFPLLNAHTATRADVGARSEELLEITNGLHHDRELGGILGPAVTAGDCFRGIWIRRLTSDLDILADGIDPPLLQWMRDEVSALDDLTRSSAFDQTVRAPIHGDVWHENLMIDATDPRVLWLLDWDDLTIGDPIADDAVLLHDALGPDVDRWFAVRHPRDDHEFARMRVAARAVLLDEVIDVLSDAVVATDPELTTAKRTQHSKALSQYRERYGVL